jgi:hypothetical protein
MQDGLTDTYTTYACSFKPSTIAPVGEAYRIFKNEYPDEFGLLYKPATMEYIWVHVSTIQHFLANLALEIHISTD